ncbi:replication-relaxation family protein [Amycolatopsis sp. cg5]|uniref:replication-relaxation family protein n=1 Tax=Amycolatopsis sp. cg5 TaxID=3238802 RepID=UPI003524B705
MTSRSRARRLADRLTSRDRAILESLQLVRLATGQQLGRLHVAAGLPATQARKTRAALQRLTTLGLVVRLRRRIGGVRAGSNGFIYGLSGLGQAVLDLGYEPARRHRRVSETKPAFQDHTLAVTEAYVQLVERDRAGRAELLEFASEPACWRQFSGVAGELVTLKPDAFARLAADGYELSVFLELDLDTESLPTISRKLEVYRAYWHTGIEQARFGIFPKTWWLVPNTRRLDAVARTIQRLPDEQQALFTVCLTREAADLLTHVLVEGGAR